MEGYSDDGPLYAGNAPPVFSNPRNADEDNAYKEVIGFAGENRVAQLVSGDKELYTPNNYQKIRTAFKDRHFGKVCATIGLIIAAVVLLLCQILIPFGNILSITLTSLFIGLCAVGLIGFYSYRGHILSVYEDIRGKKYDTDNI